MFEFPKVLLALHWLEKIIIIPTAYAKFLKLTLLVYCVQNVGQIHILMPDRINIS